VALGVALLVQPGVGLNLTTDANFQAKSPPALVDVLANLVPKNPFEAMAKGEVLQVIFFAILFGIGLIKNGETGQTLRSSFEKLNTVLLNLVELIVRFAPVGVFALLTKTFATQGLSALSNLAAYFFTVLVVMIFHGWIFYPTVIYSIARKSPIVFLKKIMPVQMFAFATSSSNATLPLNLDVTEKKLGVENSIASFIVPLGATVNMDGTAIMQGVATVFIAQVFNVTLSVQDLAMVVVTATLASIGTAGVPGVGLIMLAMVLQQVNLPVEGIALILGVDRLLDMTRTAVNVTGDAMTSVIVAKSENKLNHSVYDSSSD
jgi:Na+/H+-dicarboxylate symporter